VGDAPSDPEPAFASSLHHTLYLSPCTSALKSMDSVETYRVQLEQAELALQTDPDNAELASLVSELKELIELTALAAAATPATTSAPKPKVQASAVAVDSWSAGNDCLAKYSGDGQWYPARIISVGGAMDKRVYSVSFRGYDSTELVDGASLKPLPASQQNGGSTYSAGAKRKLSKEEEEEKDRKKKKNEKKLEVRAQKAKEQASKQQTWQKFAKKSEKKGIHIAGTSGTSIFKTPDNPLGKGECRAMMLLCLFTD
jgi:survival of motor neuron-related-splicing factor 30